MKRLKLLFALIVFYGPFTLIAQPTFYVDEVSIPVDSSGCVGLRTKDFTDLLEVELDLSWDKRFLTLIEPRDETVSELISFTQGADNLKLNLASNESLTLDDNVMIAQLCFQANDNCNRASPIKFINLEQAKVIRQVANTEVSIGLFPQDGIVKIICENSQVFRDTLLTSTICDGANTFGVYTQSGIYVDIIPINGIDYIRTLEVQTIPFESLTCPPNDTFYLPPGFSNISLANGFIRPAVRPSNCWNLVNEEISGQPILGRNILNKGTTNFNYTFKNQLQSENCDYDITILEGELAANDMTLSLSDTIVDEGELFCLDIKVANLKNLIGHFHILEWNPNILEFIELRSSEKLDDPLYNQVDLGTLITTNLNLDFVNGIQFSDNEVLASICFRAKNSGSTAINFFSQKTAFADRPIEFITSETELLNVAIKNGQVTVTGPACNNITVEKNITICEGENFGGRTQAGRYIETFPLANGCDSTDIINLEVLPSTGAVQNITICKGENFNGWTETGFYADTIMSSLGCDSFLLVDLTVIPVEPRNVEVTICQGEVFEGRTESGVYQDIYTTSLGCDSVVTTNLTVLPIAQTNIAASICEGENLNGWTTSGAYIDTLLTATGCDSLVLTELTILAAADSMCNTITATYDAVSLNLLELFPNPANEYIILKWTPSRDAIFSIYNISGQKIQAETILKNENRINISGFKSGVYSVQITDEEKTYYAKFIKM